MNWLWTVFRLLTWAVALRLMTGLRGSGDSRSPSLGYMVAWWVAASAALVFAVLALTGDPWCMPVALVLGVFIAPWTLARYVAIPLGLSRMARFLSSLSGWTWGSDRCGGGLIAGAWALLRRARPSGDAMVALERHRDAMPRLTAAQVLATGLLSAARGDLASARRLIESVDEIGIRTTPRVVHKLAREWLVVDAVCDRRWARAVDLAATRTGKSARTTARSRITRLLGKVAARLGSLSDAPRNWQMWLAWATAPHRRSTFWLVRAAAAVGVAAEDEASVARGCLQTSLRPDLYADAMVGHVAALGRLRGHDASAARRASAERPAGRVSEGESRPPGQPSSAAVFLAEDLERLAAAWDRALADPETRGTIMQRAATLGARSGERAFTSLSECVARDLADIARAAGLGLTGWRQESKGSTILAQARRQLRGELIGEIELAFDALLERAAARRALSATDEWREWLSLRAIYQRATELGGIELRRLAFPHVHPTACKLAVWLWNDREQHLMANAMFGWLLAEALTVGDAEAIELQSRNFDETL